MHLLDEAHANAASSWLASGGAAEEEIAEAVTALRGHEPDVEELKQILRRCPEYRRGR